MAEAFSKEVIDAAWNRSGGKCECTRVSHAHGARCRTKLNKASRGKESPQGWEAHHKNSNGPGTLSNCEILCQDCHKGTQSFGRS